MKTVVSINNTSSYQASVEFDLCEERSNSDLSEMVEAIVEYDPESAILKESNAFVSEPEGFYIWMSHWQTTIGLLNTAVLP